MRRNGSTLRDACVCFARAPHIWRDVCLLRSDPCVSAFSVCFGAFALCIVGVREFLRLRVFILCLSCVGMCPSCVSRAFLFIFVCLSCVSFCLRLCFTCVSRVFYVCFPCV